uniref:Uncharacterized protein n=1 Tax=Phenylobacterium glaciei TaxID=2803784 RepID=A0A974P414_9CAUL|nr:hypothetical protein JKL49_06020 [Phenylobacterium glaciei]
MRLFRGSMQIANTLAGPSPVLPDTVAAAAWCCTTAAGRRVSTSSSRPIRTWPAAGAPPSSDRQALAKALTESPFGQRVQSTLNAFTRAAWAGPRAVPPEPQAKLLSAFDGLSEDDQQIVAGLQVDGSAPGLWLAGGIPSAPEGRSRRRPAAQDRQRKPVAGSPRSPGRRHPARAGGRAGDVPARAAALSAYTRLSR